MVVVLSPLPLQLLAVEEETRLFSRTCIFQRDHEAQEYMNKDETERDAVTVHDGRKGVQPSKWRNYLLSKR